MTKDIISKFTKYATVGVIGTCTHIGILTLLVELLHKDPVLSSMVGFIVVLLVSYYLNHSWTFESSVKHYYALPRYSIVCIVGLSLNTGIMYLTINILCWWYLWGQMSVILVIPLSNFIFNYYWSFSKTNPDYSSKLT